MPPAHSVLIVDDQTPFRLAARAVLQRLAEFELAGEASSGAEAVDLAERLHPEMVLMDINMPQMNGIEATRQILAAHPGTVVILCSTYDVRDLPPEAAASGAAGYVHKEQLAGELIRRMWAERDAGWPGPAAADQVSGTEP
jgi:DNA-binding NarL/FixJ family response regulator